MLAVSAPVEDIQSARDYRRHRYRGVHSRRWWTAPARPAPPAGPGSCALHHPRCKYEAETEAAMTTRAQVMPYDLGPRRPESAFFYHADSGWRMIAGCARALERPATSAVASHFPHSFDVPQSLMMISVACAAPNVRVDGLAAALNTVADEAFDHFAG